MSIMFSIRMPTAGTEAILTQLYTRQYTQISPKMALKLTSAFYKFCWKMALTLNLKLEEVAGMDQVNAHYWEIFLIL